MASKLAMPAQRPTEHSGGAWTFGQPLVPVARSPRVRVTQDQLQRYADNFKAGVACTDGYLPFTLNHDDARGLSGKVRAVEARPGFLAVDIEWTKLGEQAIAEQQFPLVSADLDPVWEDEAGRQYHDVLRGGSLVVRPYFKHLAPPTLQFDEDGQVAAVIISEEETMTDEERAALDAARAPLDAAPGTAGDDPTAADTPALTQLAEQLEQTRRELLVERRARRTSELRDDLAATRFSEHGHQLAPASRGPLAEALAELEPAAQVKLLDAIKAMRFYDPRERGHGDKPPAPGAGVDPLAESFAKQLGTTLQEVQ